MLATRRQECLRSALKRSLPFIAFGIAPVVSSEAFSVMRRIRG